MPAMLTLSTMFWLLFVRTVDAAHSRATSRSDRGDVPGWVLITVMSAGLVVALWAVAGDKLGTMLGDALDSVTGGAS